MFRRYLEFYVLESKLTEFHGNVHPDVTSHRSAVSFKGKFHSVSLCPGTFADAQLPSKRIIGPKNFEFLNSKREEFEEYLQVF